MTRTTFHIDAAHPALPGHFPGNPIVPGVVLLDRLAAALEAELGASLRKLPQVKFMRPLKPGEVATLTIDSQPPSGKFVIECGGDIIAKGTFEVAV